MSAPTDRANLKEIEGKLPDYSTPATRAAANRKRTFIYCNDCDDQTPKTNKKPVELDNGAIFIG